MIEYTQGNLLKSSSEALVNTVNCVGVMGRGIALQFKKAFPDNFKAYAICCEQKDLVPGKMFVYDMNTLTSPRYIINFPTKRHWRGKSRLEDVELGLRALKDEIVSLGIKSISIPPLGSGLGGLNWQDVRRLIEKHLSDLGDVKVLVYEPMQSVVSVSPSSSEVPSMTKGRAALVELMKRYLDGLLDPYVSLLEIHKLMYFLQEAGMPLRLQYTKAKYGPYAENLRHVMNVVEGHFVSGYLDGGDNPRKQISLVPGAYEDAKLFLAEDVNVQRSLQRVCSLVDGFETPDGLELLATVHWVVAKNGAESLSDAVSQTYAWNDRKKKFTERQISIAYNALKEFGWIA
ncbi:MAG: Appr-1-p processing protein [Alphaproteobacteria bacterium]|nr:Appr-1-p processing protein [Alphaproteobacteria bacterium]